MSVIILHCSNFAARAKRITHFCILLSPHCCEKKSSAPCGFLILELSGKFLFSVFVLKDKLADGVFLDSRAKTENENKAVNHTLQLWTYGRTERTSGEFFFFSRFNLTAVKSPLAERNCSLTYSE